MTNKIIFDDKSFEDILENIYSTTINKREQINIMINKLILLVQSPSDASILFPIIRDFLDTSIKNDNHLVQIAQLSQKLQAIESKAAGADGFLDEDEKNDLLRLGAKETVALQEEIKDIENKIAETTVRIQDTLK